MNNTDRRAKAPKITDHLARDDYSMLSEADKQRITEAAEAEASGALKARQEAAFKRKALHAARVERGLVEAKAEDELRQIVVDVANDDRITLDGKIYFHGLAYTVTKPVYDTINEAMARSWKHQREIEGASQNHYRRQQAPSLSGAVV